MISTIIPVYKNRELFLNNLKNNLKYLINCEIIIVNDDPSASLKTDLKDFKNIILVENKKNLGFGSAVNEGVKKAKNKYLMLLNSDVRLNDKSFEKAIDCFEKDQMLFAVGFGQKEKNGDIVGKNSIYWKNGFLHHKKNNNLSPGINAWAEGGACIINKEKFMELGGFDKLYSPFYWEDIDLSYRAWKRGYRILFDPGIEVEHQHESTIGKYFSKEKIEKIAYRNQFIFIWKNITDNELITKHVISSVLVIIKSVLKGNFSLIFGFYDSLLKFRSIMTNRSQEKNKIVNNDHAILKCFNA